MVYRNEFDSVGKASIDGERAQKNFERIYYKKFGLYPIRATKKEDMYDKIDYWMQIGTHRASVDVKSCKKHLDTVCVEFISYGKFGWVYGKADYIGFEMPSKESFIMVKRDALLEYVEKNCKVHFTRDTDNVLFNLYIRWKDKDSDKYDCTTYIPRKSLYSLPHWILE